MSVDPLQPSFKSIVVGTDRVFIARDEGGLVNHDGDNNHWQRRHQDGQIGKKAFANFALKQYLELACRFSQFMFMKHRFVMAPKAHLELLSFPTYILDIVVLPEDGKEENENRVV